MRRLPRACLSIILFLLVACSARALITQPVRLRVLTYNIHHGEGIDGVFDLERIARVILDTAPDIVAVQEVDSVTTRSGGVDQAAELGRLTGMHAVFGKAMDYAGGGYGEAVLSRFPFAGTGNHILSASPGHEPRAALTVYIRLGAEGPSIAFTGTHLDHTRDPTDRITQAGEINMIFSEERDTPMILAGDLNAVPGSEPMDLLLGMWTDAASSNPQPTIPVEQPRRRIDYILYRPAGSWRVIEATVIDERVASDHRPLLAVLEYRGGR